MAKRPSFKYRDALTSVVEILGHLMADEESELSPAERSARLELIRHCSEVSRDFG